MGFFSFLLIFFTFILFCFAWGARTLRAREGDCIINSLKNSHKFSSKWAATFHHTWSTRAVSPPRRDPRCWSTGEETSCHVHKDPRTAHNGRFHAQPAMKDLQQHAWSVPANGGLHNTACSFFPFLSLKMSSHHIEEKGRANTLVIFQHYRIEEVRIFHLILNNFQIRKDAAYKEISWLNERSFGRTKSETSYTDGGAFHISSHTFHTEEAIHAH